MTDERYTAYLAPNVIGFGERVTIKVNHAPLRPAGPVQLRLYELNDYTWVDPGDPQHAISWDEEDPATGQGRADDLLATWDGEVRWAEVSRDGQTRLEPRFIPAGAPRIANQGGDPKTLHYNTAIPVQIEGGDTIWQIPLALDAKRSYEGDTLELGVSIDRGSESLFKGRYATLVRDWRWWAQHSFAPPRAGHSIKYYTSGKDYWADLADALLAAQRTIYITGWAMDPQVKLRRPGGNPEMLAAFLAAAGRRGVRVRVLLTDTSATFKGFLDNRDEVAQAWLMAHPGIEVSRHRPDPSLVERTELQTGIDSPFWTHHQKSVMIDDQIAFVGGIDLAEGRWDTDASELDDPNALEDTAHGEFRAIAAWKQLELQRGSRPRMPWHDIHTRITGPSARDVSQNFIERWNKASPFQRDSLERRLSHIEPLEGRGFWITDLTAINRRLERLVPDGARMARADRLLALAQMLGEPGLAGLANFYSARSTILDAPAEYEVKVMVLTALYAFRFDPFVWRYVMEPMGALFQDRYELRDGHTWSRYIGLLLQPDQRDKLFATAGDAPAPSSADVFVPIAYPPEPPQPAPPSDAGPERPGGAVVQVVRSIGDSSLPSDAIARMTARTGRNRESSILDTYGIAINLAQHYIYIETQMLISHQNKLAEVLQAKIAQKMAARACFHVYLVVPEVYDGDPFGTDARAVNARQWKTITTLRSGLEPIARSNGVSVEDYFQVFCLRKLGKISVRDPVALDTRSIARVNLIYVHAKLMIVDDTFVTVGSANLNQRSLLGDRDSEINVNILDQDEVTIQVGDPRSTDPRSRQHAFTARRSAYELRMHLWRKHLGVDPGAEPGTEVTLHNPTHPATIRLWRERATYNHALTSGVFNQYYGRKQWDPPAELVDQMAQRGLRGHITIFGLDPEAKGEDSWTRPDFLIE
jgi:phospholipase D1/2